MSVCADPNCHPEMGCDLGEKELRNCPNWRAAAKWLPQSESGPNLPEDAGSVLP